MLHWIFLYGSLLTEKKYFNIKKKRLFFICYSVWVFEKVAYIENLGATTWECISSCKHKTRRRVSVTQPLQRPPITTSSLLYLHPSCTVCPSHCPACIVICWIYTDANSTVGCVDVQLLIPGPQRLPFLPPSYHPQHQGPPPPYSFPHPLPCSPFWLTRVLFWRFLTPQKLSVAPFLPMSGTHNRERAPAERFSCH